MSNKYKLEGESRGISIGGIGRFFSFVLILFIGIFSVYSIQNWKAEKENQKQESMYLDQLLKEGQSNYEGLTDDLILRNERLSLMKFLMENQNRSVGTDTLRMAIRQLMVNDLFLSNENLFQYLSTTGDLNFINSLEIRSKISELTNSVKEISWKQTVEQRLIEEKIETYLIDEGVISLLETLSNSDQINTSQQQVDRIIRVLLNDRKFVDLVYLRYSRLNDVINSEMALASNLRQLMELLNFEIQTIEANR